MSKLTKDGIKITVPAPNQNIYVFIHIPVMTRLCACPNILIVIYLYSQSKSESPFSKGKEGISLLLSPPFPKGVGGIPFLIFTVIPIQFFSHDIDFIRGLRNRQVMTSLYKYNKFRIFSSVSGRTDIPVCPCFCLHPLSQRELGGFCFYISLSFLSSFSLMILIIFAV